LFRTSAMRSAETLALGKRINIADIIRNAKKICIEYCIKAIMSPTRMLPTATSWEPTQIMDIETTFIMMVMRGISTTIALVT